MKLHLNPFYRGEDRGDGGIRRVVEAQQLYLPELGIEVIDDPILADVCAMHAGNWTRTQGPTVSHCHGLYWEEYEWPEWAHQVNRDVVGALHKADIVTAPSEWVASALRKGMWLDPIVIHHGVDCEEWTPGDNEGYVLWNKTRVDPVCDVEPVNRLASALPDEQFVSTYGDKNLTNLLVTGTLPFDNAKEIVRNAGIYLCTSRETFGIGTLEAMACGVPILGWAWGGQREIVEHKITGWLANPGDYDGLREGYEYIQRHHADLSKECRSIAEKFTWRRVMPLYKFAYDEAIRRHAHEVKVSVVITNYKLEHFLLDAVNSVLAQEQFEDYEIIIVNDASPTWTRELEHQLYAKSSRIRIINNPENLYLAGALNVGIGAARGKYIVPLDADNMLGERALGVLSGALDKDRDIDIVYGAMEVIWENGKREISGWPGDFSYRQQLAHRNQLTSTSMYRKTIWERAGGYRSRCRTAEDADFWCRVTSLGAKPRRVTDSVVLRYRNRSDSMSHVEKDWGWNDWYPTKQPMGVSSQIPSFEPELVSVVIPVGPGHDRLVVDALDSIWAQTFQKWEVIVVNDSGKKFDWIHPFARVLTTEGGVGPAVARNLGIEAAKGKLVLLLDADDYLQRTALEEMYQAWKPGAYVYSDWYTEAKVYQAPDYNCQALLQGLPHAVTVMFARSVAARFDEQLEGWEDWDFILQLNKEGLCGTRVPRPLFSYRTLAGNRREQMYARREELKKNIYAKWESFIEGREILMGCGCASSKSPMAQLRDMPSMASLVPPNGDYVLLEFVSEELAPRSYRGPKTGAMYRFGGMGHRIKYVHKDDAIEFLLRPEFAEAGAADERRLEVMA